MLIVKRILFIGIAALLMALPVASWAASVPAKVYETGKDNNPVAQPGVKVEVLSGVGFKSLLSSAETGKDGGCLLENVPLGKDVAVRLTKAGYVRQYDVRSFGDADIESGAVFWTGSEAALKGLYANLGETFDVTKGHIYLDISNEMTGDGIEGIQLAASSGKVFDLGDGEYLIANSEGSKVKVAIAKPGYSFDIESATIPLFAGAMTQYYINVQSGGAVFQATQVTAASITGFIRRLSDAVGLSGVSVAFTFRKGPQKGQTAGPTVTTNAQGFYISQSGFPVGERIQVTPSINSFTKPGAVGGYKLKPVKKAVKVKETGAVADFKAKPL